MRKQNFLKFVRMSALLFGVVALTLTSCKDYDEDFDRIDKEIAANTAAIDALELLVGNGQWVTGVTKNATGDIVFTLANGGTPITINTDGAGGTIWAVNETTGMWMKNGVDTDYVASKNLPPMIDGGYWAFADEKGVYVKSTTVATGSYTTTDVDGNLVLNVFNKDENKYTSVILPTSEGGSIASLNYVPEIVVNGNETAPFYVVTRLNTDTSYDEDGKVVTGNDEVAMTAYASSRFTGLSSLEDMVYHVNPTNAILSGVSWSYVHDSVKVVTRATSEYPTDFLYVDPAMAPEAVVDGKVVIKTRMNFVPSVFQTIGATNRDMFDQFTLAANYKVEEGADEKQITSEYAIAEAQRIAYADVKLVNDAEFVADKASISDITDYVLTPASAEKTTVANTWNDLLQTEVKTFVALSTYNEDSNAVLPYNETLDLNKVVEPYALLVANTVFTAGGYTAFEDINIEDVPFRFSLPEKFIGDDVKKTNEQDFVNLSADGILSVKSAYGIAAVNRTPLVKVELLSDGIFGEVEVIATAYMMVNITPESRDALVINMPAMDINYVDLFARNANADGTVKAKAATTLTMDWVQMNKDVYKELGLTHAQFVAIYGNRIAALPKISSRTPGLSEKATKLEATFGYSVATVNEGGNALASTDTYEYNVTIQNTNDAGNANNQGIQWRDEAYVWTLAITPKVDSNYPVINIVYTFNIVAPKLVAEFNPAFTAVEEGVTYQTVKGQILADDSYEMSANLAEAFKYELLDGKTAPYINYPVLGGDDGVEYMFNFDPYADLGARKDADGNVIMKEDGVTPKFPLDTQENPDAEIVDAAGTTPNAKVTTSKFVAYAQGEKMRVTTTMTEGGPFLLPVDFTEYYPNGQELSIPWTVRFVDPVEVTIGEMLIGSLPGMNYLNIANLIDVKFANRPIFEKGAYVLATDISKQTEDYELSLAKTFGIVEFDFDIKKDDENVGQNSTLKIVEGAYTTGSTAATLKNLMYVEIQFDNNGSDVMTRFDAGDVSIILNCKNATQSYVIHTGIKELMVKTTAESTASSTLVP